MSYLKEQNKVHSRSVYGYDLVEARYTRTSTSKGL